MDLGASSTGPETVQGVDYGGTTDPADYGDAWVVRDCWVSDYRPMEECEGWVSGSEMKKYVYLPLHFFCRCRGIARLDPTPVSTTPTPAQVSAKSKKLPEGPSSAAALYPAMGGGRGRGGGGGRRSMQAAAQPFFDIKRRAPVSLVRGTRACA